MFLVPSFSANWSRTTSPTLESTCTTVAEKAAVCSFWYCRPAGLCTVLMSHRNPVIWGYTRSISRYTSDPYNPQDTTFAFIQSVVDGPHLSFKIFKRRYSKDRMLLLPLNWDRNCACPGDIGAAERLQHRGVTTVRRSRQKSSRAAEPHNCNTKQ